MRFFKVLEDIPNKYFKKLEIKQGDVILKSKYYCQGVICATSTQKTKHFDNFGYNFLEMLIDNKIRFLTNKELNKLRPHLTKQMLEHDL